MTPAERFERAMERFMASGAAATDKGGQALDALSNALETAGAAYGAPVTAAGGRGVRRRSRPERHCKQCDKFCCNPERMLHLSSPFE